MTAGWGAEQQARQAERRVGQKRRELAMAEQQAHAWAAGAEGERLVAAELDTLTAHGWRALHDVHWPGRPRANLDHVLVGPGGVIVVDSKNWRGNVDVRHGTLRANGYGKSRECEAVAAEAAAVAAFLQPQHRSAAIGVLCLVQQDVAATPSAGIVVVGRSSIAAFCLSRPVVLSPAEVHAVTDFLTSLLTGPTSPPQLTSGHVLQAAGRPREPLRAVRPMYRRRGRSHPVAMRSTKRSPRRPPSGAVPTLAKLGLAVLVLLTAQFWLPLVSGVVGGVLTDAVLPDRPAVVHTTPIETAPAAQPSP